MGDGALGGFMKDLKFASQMRGIGIGFVPYEALEIQEFTHGGFPLRGFRGRNEGVGGRISATQRNGEPITTSTLVADMTVVVKEIIGPER